MSDRYWILDALPAYGDARGKVRAPRTSQRRGEPMPPRKVSNVCVMTPDGQMARCFSDRDIAKKVLRGFGPGFTLKRRG